MLIYQGAHPEATKRHLGHGDIATTMNTYGHLFPSDEERLAERLDELLEQAGREDVVFWWVRAGLPLRSSEATG